MSLKVLLGMSGGIDSTVSAVLLQEQGYEVVGVYMKLHENEEYHKENFSRAQKVADYLNIEVKFLDLTREFNDEVYQYFVDSYKAGVTPNPCVMCNRTIKFGAMVEFADSLGIEKVATGHYLRSDGEFIYKAVDQSKDQSYFLAEVKSEVISRLVFPLGEWHKSDVKKFASKIKALECFATQKESSEICFVPNEYTDILSKHMDINLEGDVLNTNGDRVGKHKGYMHYTIGKRRGFSVNGAHDPHYVVSLNPDSNEIVVGTREHLSQSEFEIDKINLFENLKDFKCEVKVRYRTASLPAQITIFNDRGKVKLSSPVFGLARGQFAVFYDGDRLLGGGVIL